jgi:hypothetical protein
MHPNRATIVYGIMILFSASGVWAILSFGQRLIAPEDLAGKWTLESRRDTTQPAPGDMTVQQSGKFFQIAFENGPKLNLVLEEQSPLSVSDGQPVTLALGDGPWRLTFHGPQGGDEMELNITAPLTSQSGVWNAKRLVRKFPPDVSSATATGAH